MSRSVAIVNRRCPIRGAIRIEPVILNIEVGLTRFRVFSILFRVVEHYIEKHKLFRVRFLRRHEGCSDHLQKHEASRHATHPQNRKSVKRHGKSSIKKRRRVIKTMYLHWSYHTYFGSPCVRWSLLCIRIAFCNEVRLGCFEDELPQSITPD